MARAKKVVVAAASDMPPLNGDVFPVSDGPALKFVALDAIEIAGQVRTGFDEQALAELADDMKVRGVLQPVLLCSEVDGVYRLIAGERRVRAARMAGLSAVPALVGAATVDAVLDMQLAENIQREDLSLTDEANAVRRLYDRWGKVDLVAQHVKKSPAWVSKRLAVTYGDFDWRAKQLLVDGVTEDIELLQCVVKVAALDQFAANQLDREIRAGSAGRKEARATLAKLKKKPAVATKPPKSVVPAVQSPGEVPVGGSVGESEKPAFDGRAVLCELVDNLRHEECPPVAEMVSELSDEQQAVVLAVCRGGFELGGSWAGLDSLALLRRVAGLQALRELEDWTLAALTLGAFGMPFELGMLLSEVRVAIRSV